MRSHKIIALTVGFYFTITGCSGQEATARPEGWSDATHGKDVAPNYEQIFSTAEVHTVQITIDPSHFQAMQEDLTALLGDRGTGQGAGGFGGGRGGDFEMPTTEEDSAGTGGGFPGGSGASPEGSDNAGEGAAENGEWTPPSGSEDWQNADANGEAVGAAENAEWGPPGGDGDWSGPGNGAGGGALDLLADDPIYVPVTLSYQGHTWEHVGMRYKGNSSLLGAQQSGNGKIGFRLDFDEFEDDFPEIDDQRFYGFKKLTFASNWSDDSQLREAFVNEVLRERGIPAARCAFYRVEVDVGAGLTYWGLYTMIEDPADGAMLDSQLGGRGGNLYKPEGTGADWTTFSEDGFDKKTNEEAADYTDVESAIAALHADRTSDPAAWRTALEATFDVEHFLNWLAVNTAIVNWDSYGSMAHNYYIYALPESAQLRWIPWDHNLAMTAGGGFGGGGFGGGGFGGGGEFSGAETTTAATTATAATGSDLDSAYAEVFHTNISDSWPLIRYLLDDPVYVEVYRGKLAEALQGLLVPEVGIARLQTLHELIAPHLIGDQGEQEGYTTITSAEAFTNSVAGEDGLAAHLQSRYEVISTALAQD